MGYKKLLKKLYGIKSKKVYNGKHRNFAYNPKEPYSKKHNNPIKKEYLKSIDKDSVKDIPKLENRTKWAAAGGTTAAGLYGMNKYEQKKQKKMNQSFSDISNNKELFENAATNAAKGFTKQQLNRASRNKSLWKKFGITAAALTAAGIIIKNANNNMIKKYGLANKANRNHFQKYYIPPKPGTYNIYDKNTNMERKRHYNASRNMMGNTFFNNGNVRSGKKGGPNSYNNYYNRNNRNDDFDYEMYNL